MGENYVSALDSAWFFSYSNSYKSVPGTLSHT